MRTGALPYFAYTYLLMAFGGTYNDFILAYVALFSAKGCQKGCQRAVATGHKAAPGLESEYKPELPAGRLPARVAAS
jgi:hypothetical protein